MPNTNSDQLTWIEPAKKPDGKHEKILYPYGDLSVERPPGRRYLFINPDGEHFRRRVDLGQKHWAAYLAERKLVKCGPPPDPPAPDPQPQTIKDEESD